MQPGRGLGADTAAMRGEVAGGTDTISREKMCPMKRAWLAAVVVLIVGGLAVSALAASSPTAPSLPGYPLLVNRAELVVFGPALHAHTPCPHVLPLPREAASTIKLAVELAMPPLARRIKLDGRDPQVRVAPATRSGFSFLAAGCGRIAWSRSVVASVFLPHVQGASLSQHTFAVGRVQQGWVLWGFIH